MRVLISWERYDPG